jgi:hypothetical protein
MQKKIQNGLSSLEFELNTLATNYKYRINEDYCTETVLQLPTGIGLVQLLYYASARTKKLFLISLHRL